MKPRTAEELAASQSHSVMCPGCDRCLQSAADWADAHWADDPQPAIEFFGGRVGRTESRHENPNAVYQRALDTHMIERNEK